MWTVHTREDPGAWSDPLGTQTDIPTREYIPTIHSCTWYDPDVVRAPQSNKYIYTEKKKE